MGMKNRGNKTNHPIKHGMCGTRLYRIWHSMKQRCNNPNNTSYHNYGGKSIRVCKEWNEFQGFSEWAISNGYSDELTLDRINGDGNYEPSNCRWITMKEQQNNKSDNHLLTYNGKTQNIMQWAEELQPTLGITYSMINKRINRQGWSVESALSTPHVKQDRLITYNGETKNLSDWAKVLGVSRKIISTRLSRGWDEIDAITIPKGGKRNAKK